MHEPGETCENCVDEWTGLGCSATDQDGDYMNAVRMCRKPQGHDGPHADCISLGPVDESRELYQWGHKKLTAFAGKAQ